MIGEGAGGDVVQPGGREGTSGELGHARQRASNENTNGLLRQFMTEGTDVGDASQTWLNQVAALTNNRPRKTLSWRSPAEAMADELPAFRLTVALEAGILAHRVLTVIRQTQRTAGQAIMVAVESGCGTR